MGIPRLTSDVAPFAQDIVLGKSPSHDQDVNTRSAVVIDGPSLVYHICDRLWYRITDSDTATIPSYAEINAATCQFLADLQSAEVHIEKIFFDGALPLQKLPERLQRLNHVRQQIQSLRRLPSRPPSVNIDFDPASLQQRLWQTARQNLDRSRHLPHPCLMVPSVIEHLNKSLWFRKVQVVPGESDPFCALWAIQSHAAILSNDSDLLLYALGPNGCIVNFHSLERHVGVSGAAIIRARCFRPMEIAKQLNVPTMLDYGFERYKDASVSVANVAERARTHGDQILESPEWRTFAQMYDHNQIAGPYVPLGLTGLDPRLAEVVCMRTADQPPRCFLPVLLEDHDMDSSWTYGTEIRRLAYSMVVQWLHGSTSGPDDIDADVAEYLRRGNGIVESRITILPKSGIVHLLRQLQDRGVLLRKQDGDFHDAALDWFIAAMEIVVKEKSARGKDVTMQVMKLFDYDARRQSSHDWSQLHLIASVQAVLYSLRMLTQTLYYISHSSPEASGIPEPIHVVYATIRDMPSIPDMFLDFEQFRRKFFLAHDKAVIKQRIERVLLQVGAPPKRSLRMSSKHSLPFSQVKDNTSSSLPISEIIQDRSARVKKKKDRCRKPRTMLGAATEGLTADVQNPFTVLRTMAE